MFGDMEYDLVFLDHRMPGMDGVAGCGGVQAHLEALKIFAESIAARSEEIERCCAHGDITGYTIKVHALKSMARSTGLIGIEYAKP